MSPSSGAGAPTIATSFSCTDEEYRHIRARAEREGATLSAYVIRKGLTVRLPGEPEEARVAQRLILTEGEQREMHAALRRAPHDTEGWARALEERVALVLDAVLIDMLWQGRGEQLRTLLAQGVGGERAAALAERLESEARKRGLVP